MADLTKERLHLAGGSGAGKSLFQNLGVNWSLAGLNVVYISLELSEQLISMRPDAMVFNTAQKKLCVTWMMLI